MKVNLNRLRRNYLFLRGFHITMILSCISIHLLVLQISRVSGNSTSPCDLSDTPITFLNVAVEMINKAKLNFPMCPAITSEKESKPLDCEDLLRSGHNASGVYTIWPKSRVTNGRPIDVFCDMDTGEGGWTVIQRRGNYNRSIDYFFKDWKSYKEGFGDIEKEFWLGNDNIFALTSQHLYSIRFDLKAMNGEKRYALYDTFWIDDENHKYTLHIQDYSGDAGDSMIWEHDNQKFSTKDQDNDNHGSHCANTLKSGWWYKSCYTANLNGLNLRGSHKNNHSGISWHAFRGNEESLNTTEMKIRSSNFSRKRILEKSVL
ncbi:techylectin-5A [Trichonephila inaurata madagascariensis]|uniref:Techylectin-5A n=1 Tax=Trichonephila inaurata madagascariensis TaxID=2747483 RepID=A0A8X6XS23_9ARAC|nr:techylectin-5A [Trichonephila inaurata madagascariensis]